MNGLWDGQYLTGEGFNNWQWKSETGAPVQDFIKEYQDNILNYLKLGPQVIRTLKREKTADADYEDFNILEIL